MADVIDNAEFRLPSHFLTDDDILLHKQYLRMNGVDAGLRPNKSFHPSEFPYGFDSFSSSSPALNSLLESLVGSAETELDEEDLIAELTCQLARSTTLHETQKLAASEKAWLLSGSPQSTLSAHRSWSGSPNGMSQKSSPSTTPLSSHNDAWDVIYAAAGQVARLKMGVGWPNKYSHHYKKNTHLLGRSVDPYPLPLMKPHCNRPYSNNHILTHNLSQTNQFGDLRQCHDMKPQNSSIWGRQAMEAECLFQQNQLHQLQPTLNRGRFPIGHENGMGARSQVLPQPPRPPPVELLQQQNRSGSGIRAVFLGGGDGESSGLKRKSSGTGVFLPRRYGNPPESRKKPVCSTVLLPARVVQALNLNIEDMSIPAQPHLNNSCPLPDRDSMLARRKAVLVEQQKLEYGRMGLINNEMRLPQEWSY